MTALSDADIERLLSEAETRLSAQASHRTNVLAVPAAHSSSLGSSSEVAKGNGQKKEATHAEVAVVRVPRLPERKSKTAKDNAGPNWFNMPRTKMTPELKKDLQLLRMRSVLNPGQFFKKDTRKDPVPEFSQVGMLVSGATDPASSRLTRKERKRTIVEEVLATDDVMAKFKTRYDKIQESQTSGKKAHYKKVMARRRRGK